MFESILCQVTEYDAEILQALIELAVEIAREGREGRRIGTLFTLGDEQAVLAKSRSLILDPLVGHPESLRHVSNPNLRGTVKELAQLDGAFVVSHDGIVLAACRYLDSFASEIDAAARSREPAPRRGEHKRRDEGSGHRSLRELCSPALLPWKTCGRDHPRAVDD